MEWFRFMHWHIFLSLQKLWHYSMHVQCVWVYYKSVYDVTINMIPQYETYLYPAMMTTFSFSPTTYKGTKIHNVIASWLMSLQYMQSQDTCTSLTLDFCNIVYVILVYSILEAHLLPPFSTWNLIQTPHVHMLYSTMFITCLFNFAIHTSLIMSWQFRCCTFLCHAHFTYPASHATLCQCLGCTINCTVA